MHKSIENLEFKYIMIMGEFMEEELRVKDDSVDTSGIKRILKKQL